MLNSTTVVLVKPAALMLPLKIDSPPAKLLSPVSVTRPPLTAKPPSPLMVPLTVWLPPPIASAAVPPVVVMWRVTSKPLSLSCSRPPPMNCSVGLALPR